MDWFSYGGNSVDSSIYGSRQQANCSLSSQSQGETVAVVDSVELALEKCGDVKRRSNYEVCRGTSGCQYSVADIFAFGEEETPFRRGS